MFYWSLKSVPELQRRSTTERRQAAWQMGMRPFFVLQVWIALFATGFLMLWGLETLTGNILINHRITAGRVIAWVAGAGAIVYVAHLIYTHVYIKAMRPYIRRVSFDYSEGWLSGWIKGTIMSVISGCLMIGSVLTIDWMINLYDAAPPKQVVAMKKWPKHIPVADNGFFTAAGLMAPVGESPAKAGEHWVAVTNKAAAGHGGAYAEAPHGLKYAAFAAPGDAGAGKEEDAFCDVGNESCWTIWREQRAAVSAWLAANQDLLARYTSLQNYPDWQFPIMSADEKTPGPAYDALLNGQSLYLASAIQEMSKGVSGKRAAAKWQVELFGRGLAMIGRDIDMVRTMLAGTDSLEGKMVAATMLMRDLALLAETIDTYPSDVRPHWDRIGRMLKPFSKHQVSVADGYRFEERLSASSSEARFAHMLNNAPHRLRTWLMHHYKKQDTARMMAAYWESVRADTGVKDVSRTLPVPQNTEPVLSSLPRWTGYLYNQGGKYMLLHLRPRYEEYANRMFDLNAMNAMMRVRAQLAIRHFTLSGVPVFLGESAKHPDLVNPLTGKPFEWDAERRQLYFKPVTGFLDRHFGLGSTVPGRLSLGM